MLGAELKGIPAVTAIPAGAVHKSRTDHKYTGLKAPIVCAERMAAAYKYSASGSPGVKTRSVVYRY